MASRGLSIAASGMHAAQSNVDIISHNIANANTTAFKKVNAEFADLLYINESRAGGQISNNSEVILPVGVQFGTGVKLQAVSKDFTQGALEKTKNPLHIAISGEGFLPVVLQDGSLGYTRDGHLQIDSSTNQLVTSSGHLLEPGITIPNDYHGLMISKDGAVSVLGIDEGIRQQLGRLQLVRFPNLAGLDAIGSNLYLQTDASGEPIEGNPQEGDFGYIEHGVIEASNVNPVIEITDLIKAQRVYEMNATVIKSQDSMLSVATSIKS